MGIKLESKAVNDSMQSSLALGSQLVSQNKIDVGVGNQASFSGADIQAPQIGFTKTDPNKTGELILGGSINTTQTSHTEKNETAGVWQEMSGHGSTVQTLNQTSLNGTVSFDSALKITAQIPDTKGGQELKSQINALITQGNGVGLDYLNTLAANPNVQWDKVALANEHWSYQSQGLTPAGAALLSIAVAAYAPGLSSGITSSITSVAGASTAAALNAGFIALQAQAAVALVNNGGDIGKTLSQLGSSDSIKGLLITMVTAGALNSLDQALGFTNSTQTATGQTGAGSLGANGVATSQAANQFGQNLLKNITNNIASAVIDAAISGKPFNADSLSKALTNALVTAGMAAGVNAIGDAATGQDGQPAQIDAFTQKIAHAILGCAGGAAIAGNSSGCSAGAVGEMTAELAKDAKLSDANALALAKVVSAAAGVLVGGGGDNVAAVNVAATAGANAAENNYLKHAERLALNKAQKDCYGGNDQACATATALKRKDELSDKLLANATASCKGSECNDVTNFVLAQMRSIGCTGPNACPDYNTLSNYLRVAQEKAQGIEAVYPESWVLDAKAIFDLGKFGMNLLSNAAGSRGSLDALGQLAKTDAAAVSNNFYREGSNPAYWTNGKTGDASLNLATHWEKHGAEFPNFSSANDYYRGVSEFVNTPPPGTLVKTASNGDVLLYNPATNTFGVRTADGLPRTMFKPEPSQHGFPTNIDFWNAK